MINWNELSNLQKNELIAENILGWRKRNNTWYKFDQQQHEEIPTVLPQFATDPTFIWIILDRFDSYQITKMFPPKYRTIVQANKHVSFSADLNESVCKAALKAVGILEN